MARPKRMPLLAKMLGEWSGGMISPYLLEHRHLAVKRCRHGIFMYNRNDLFIGMGLDLYGEWCEFEIRTMRQFIEPGDTVVDVGANIGTHAVAFANLVGPAGVVHAFEPQRRTFCMLAGNVALNTLENVHCHHKAVGDEVGKIRVPDLPSPDVSFNYGQQSLLERSDTGETVPLITLDSLDLPGCRLIKIDTEGMEPQVVAGARRLIDRCRPLLYVENNERHGSGKISKLLKELRYAARWSLFSYYDPWNFYGNNVNVWPQVMPSANLMCVPVELDLRGRLSDAEPFLGEQDDWAACLQRMRSRPTAPSSAGRPL